MNKNFFLSVITTVFITGISLIIISGLVFSQEPPAGSLSMFAVSQGEEASQSGPSDKDKGNVTAAEMDDQVGAGDEDEENAQAIIINNINKTGVKLVYHPPVPLLNPESY